MACDSSALFYVTVTLQTHVARAPCSCLLPLLLALRRCRCCRCQCKQTTQQTIMIRLRMLATSRGLHCEPGASLPVSKLLVTTTGDLGRLRQDEVCTIFGRALTFALFSMHNEIHALAASPHSWSRVPLQYDTAKSVHSRWRGSAICSLRGSTSCTALEGRVIEGFYSTPQ